MEEGISNQHRTFTRYPSIVHFDFYELLNSIRSSAKEVVYYSLENEKAGTWSDLLNEDLFICASIHCFQLNKVKNRIAEEYVYYSRISSVFQKKTYLLSITNEFILLGSEVDQWISEINSLSIHSFGKQLLTSFLHSNLNEAHESIKNYCSELKNEEYFGDAVYEKNFFSKGDFYLAAIEIVQEYVCEIKDRLLFQPVHRPELALLYSFVSLLEYPYNNVNSLPRKLVYSYFINYLSLSTTPSKSERVYLSFQPYPTSKRIHFTENIEVDNSPSCYSTLQAFTISKAELWNYYLVNKNFSSTKSLRGNFCSSIELETTLINSLIKEKTKNLILGIMISSPILILPSGERWVSIIIEFSASSYIFFTKLLKEFSLLEKLSMDEFKVLIGKSLFLISISMEEGWQSMDTYTFSCNDALSSIILSFTITTNLGKLIIPSTIHKDTIDFEFNYPAVKILLNPEAYYYGYSLLEGLIIEEVKIDTIVEEFNELELYTTHGAINSSTPFYPFGSLPSKGDYLVVGSNLVFNEFLTSLNLRLCWFNLPDNAQGFEGHYRFYPDDISTSSFKSNCSFLTNGKWGNSSRENLQTLPLFESMGSYKVAKNDSCSSKISKETVLTIQLPCPLEQNNGDEEFSNLSVAGFLKLELVEPDFGFGHKIYPQLLSEALLTKSMNSIQKKLSKRKETHIPEPPYTPQLSSLKASYSASVVVFSSRLNNHQKGPTCIQFSSLGFLPYDKIPLENLTLFPRISESSSFYFGFKKVDFPDTLTFLVEFEVDQQETPRSQCNSLDWFYLSNNSWKPIHSSSIIRDDTNGFTTTGIICMEVPYFSCIENTLLPKEFSWLKINSSDLSTSINYPTRITMNCVEAVKKTDLKNSGNVEQEGDFTLRHHKEGIQCIRKVAISSNYIAEEAMPDFLTRVVEYTKHKNRPITKEDFERILVSSFKTIAKATCFTDQAYESKQQQQSIVVVVNATDQSLFSEEYLTQLEVFLRERTSPFVSITVINPVFEYVKLVCTVKFLANQSIGNARQNFNDTISTCIQNDRLGGELFLEDIVQQLRQLPYVESILTISMLHLGIDEHLAYFLKNASDHPSSSKTIKASHPWVILTPVAQHEISIHDDETNQLSIKAGIGHLSLGQDLIIP